MQKPTILYGEEKPTYYVIAEPPYREHHSRISARNEATRLSKLTPGTKFSVVKLKDSLVYDPAGTGPVNEENVEKQVAARASLEVGAKVRVRKSHHAHAGRTGIITRMGDLTKDDLSIYVILDGEIEERRFSPSSLGRAFVYKSDGNDEPKADDAAGLEAPTVAALLTDLLIGAAMGKLSQLFEVPEDIPGGIKTDDLKNHQARVSAIPPGTEVGVIMGSPKIAGLIPAEIVKARILGPSASIHMVRVDFTPSGGPDNEEASISRVYRLDDPELAVSAGYL